MIVLGWLRTDRAVSKQLKVFVANRVNNIKTLTKDSEWRYVPTDVNPADYISRGVDQIKVSVQKLWWNGPSFLTLSETDWPTVDKNKLKNVQLPEIKLVGTLVANVNNKNTLIDFERYSKLKRLQNAIAYLLRFIKNCRIKNR